MSVNGPLGATESGALEIRPGAERARAHALTDRGGLVALGGLLVTTLLIAVAAAQTNVLLPESVRPVPSWLAGPFGSSGLSLGSVGAMVVLAAMFVAYVFAARSAGRLSARAVLMCIAGMHALVLLAPPLLSTDVFSYQFYGRMGAIYGANPYLAGPHALALDPLFPYIGAKWSYTPTVYGPLFTALSYALAPLSIAASAVAYKAIAAFSSLAIIALVWNSAKLRGIDPVKAVALVGLNPLIVVYGVGGAHNDLLMMVGLMAGVYLILAHRERSGSAMMVAASAIKLTAGLMLAFAVASGGGRRARDRRRDVLIGAAAAGVLLIGLAFAWFGVGPLHLFATVQKVQSEGDWHSVPGLLGVELGNTVGHISGIVLGSVFVVICGRLLLRVWQGRMDWIDAGAWTALALLLTASSLLPWYVVWLLPLAALATDRRLWKLTIMLSGAVELLQVVGYFPHAVLLVQ
ncbi:MAG TPA: polyprenol phosphomannose-dependent alpha 1,6 mannosyltransferase MptB [Solirubrobacteraceae bacterium]|nr:polyprenol phosphomannose-dependent alpha 1,6 mannosyltransferase MptB [Solirubrobacteraceae bacterium]